MRIRCEGGVGRLRALTAGAIRDTVANQRPAFWKNPATIRRPPLFTVPHQSVSLGQIKDFLREGKDSPCRIEALEFARVKSCTEPRPLWSGPGFVVNYRQSAVFGQAGRPVHCGHPTATPV